MKLGPCVCMHCKIPTRAFTLKTQTKSLIKIQTIKHPYKSSGHMYNKQKSDLHNLHNNRTRDHGIKKLGQGFIA